MALKKGEKNFFSKIVIRHSPVKKIIVNDCRHKALGFPRALFHRIMNATDIISCAEYFQNNYLKTFYLVGIPKNTYKSNGYSNPKHLFNDILRGNPVHNAIIPNKITPTSKMYQKVVNFTKSTDIL